MRNFDVTTYPQLSAGNHEQEREAYTNKTYTAFEARYVMPKSKVAAFSNITISGPSLVATPGLHASFKCQSSIFNSGYDYGNSFFSFNSGKYFGT